MSDRDDLRERLEDIEDDDEQMRCTNLDISFTDPGEDADAIAEDGLVIDFNEVDT